MITNEDKLKLLQEWNDILYKNYEIILTKKQLQKIINLSKKKRKDAK